MNNPFWSKVDKRQNDECWLWLGAHQSQGYGAIKWGGIVVLAHRLAYELTTAEIPDGMTIDHLCRTRGCVNPRHLEVVGIRENINRGRTHRRPDWMTHCRNGHEYTEDNTYVQPDRSRKCKTCVREYNARKYAERKLLAAA